MKTKSEDLISLTLIIITILFLYGTPSFIYSNPRILDVYAFSHIIDIMTRYGGNFFTGNPMYKSQFQASTILFSIISQYASITSLAIAKYYTIYLMSMISLLLYSTAKKISIKYYIIAPMAYLSLGWVPEYNLAPQSISLLLTCVLQLVLISILKSNSNNSTKVSLAIIIWVTMCLSHALTPIMNLVSFIIIFLVDILSKKKLHILNVAYEIRSKVSKVFRLMVLYTTIYVSYILYQSEFIIKRVISTIEAILTNINSESTFVVIDRSVIEPSYSYLLGYKLRMLIIVITITIGLLCALIILLTEGEKPLNIYISGLFLGYTFIGIFLVATGYNIYGTGRTYIFLLIPFSILCSMCMNEIQRLEHNKYLRLVRYSVVVFIVVSMTILPITRYASDPYNFISESELTGKNFCLKEKNTTYYGNIQVIYPIPFEYAYYTHYYNFIEMKSKEGKEYADKFNEINIIYNSGQFKTSKV
ncbi:hypothetical protein [Methanosarcina mazei]|uniref:hypothetical protein n=1 Tax=Methanosarcina mazei TaxID=2209 RepID=UPI0012D37DBC|nr:hypothetical protein [Methanosarcina mazei]